MYIHESVKTDRFIPDKKLNLLKHGIITVAQFVNLIDINDPYTIIGPAVVAKDKINDFIEEWKTSTINLKTLSEAFVDDIKPEMIYEQLPAFAQYFPEITNLINELQEKIEMGSTCPKCVKNRYLISILSEIKKLYKDGRYLGDLEEFINAVIDKYFPNNSRMLTEDNVNEFDIMWVKPDSLIGLGNDLIMGLSNCFDCCKKHISRAKIFYEEWQQGYPEHGTLMYNEFTEANKVIEEGYVLYWDSLGQLDMASCELVGYNFGLLEKTAQVALIELANKIRSARILFQEDSTKVPDWNNLLIEVQRLQNNINKLKQ